MEVDLGNVMFYDVISPASRLEISELVDESGQQMSPFKWNDDVCSDATMSPPASCVPSVNGSNVVGSTGSGSTATPCPMLPPCRVCGEKASGFHYGANTCEACKGFFRRSLQRKEDYKCAGYGTCEILPGKRSVCAACRYRKCLRVGMSKQAIKTGRYTHEKKTKDIQEVKRLQQLQQKLLDGDIDTIDSDVINFNTDTDDVMPCSVVVTDDTMERTIIEITLIHEQQTPHTREFFDRLPAKENEYVEQRMLRQEVFGPLKPIPHQEYLRIYESTGIDVDGRRDMIKHMIPCIEKAIKRFITFAKALPGFKDLPLDDQIALIKGSRFEAWLLSAYKAFNTNLRIFTHVCGYTLHIDEMSRLYDIGFLQNVFRVAGALQKFGLSTEEQCILKGILVLSRDRCPLQDPDSVERCQEKLLELMEYIRCKRRPSDRLFIPRLIGVLVELRSLTDLHQRQEGKIGLEWCTDIKIPPLLYEIFSV